MRNDAPPHARRQLWNEDHGRVEEACRESLAKLGLAYVDLYLMHCARALLPPSVRKRSRSG